MRWSIERAKEWYEQRPWTCGFNYVPSTAVNSTEMWQAESFDLKTIARELATRGVTCNAIAPGFIDTDMTQTMDEKTLTAAMQQVPMGHMGKAEDIASAAAFLCSEAAGYITGAVLQVDGGMYM